MHFNNIVTVPSNHKVGSGPREHMSLRMVEATKVLIPVCLGKVITMADDIIMTTQISADIEELIAKIEKSVLLLPRY